MKLDVIETQNGEKVDTIELNDSVFNHAIRKDILHSVIRWQLAKRREGNHKAKGRSEVKHTKKKPFKQKGTGRARQGRIGVAQMRGGGAVFGPVVRSHAHQLNKKTRAQGLKVAISLKNKSNKFVILDKINIDSISTKSMLSMLDKIGLINKKILFVTNDNYHNIEKSVSNIINCNVIKPEGLNVYDVIRHEVLVMSKESTLLIEKRLM